MTIEQVIADQRRRLITDIEAPMMRALIREYATAAARLSAEAERLATIAMAADDPMAALIQQRRLQTLAEQAEREIERITQRAHGIITERQRVAIIASLQNVHGMAVEVGVLLNTPAAERIIASLAEESPLARLLGRLPPDVGRNVRDALMQGVIRGQNPRRSAADISAALGRNRALTIARTETLRAYRGAALETFRQSDAVQSWMWISALDDRACSMCIAMHGTIHPLSEPFGSHPSCRCSPGPVPRTLPPQVTPGAVQFASWEPSRQMATLGPAKFAAYRDGQVSLPDMVGRTTHRDWGLVRFERSLVSILGERARTFYGRAA